MNRRRRFAAVLCCAAVVAVTLGPGTKAREAAGTQARDDAAPGKVLVVAIPSLTWADVVERRPPVLLDLVGRSSVASLSVRTLGPVTSRAQAYATIGAGNRAGAVEEAGLALAPDEEIGGQRAGDVFTRRSGVDPGTAPVVHLAAPAIEQRNDRLLYGARVGMLGTTLHRHDRRIAAIGNADESPSPRLGEIRREVALAAMDSDGLLRAGYVGDGLLRVDPAAPLGVELNHDAVLATFDGLWDDVDVAVVELSDVWRSDHFRRVATLEQADAARAEAIARSDAALGRLVDRLDPDRDLLLVLAPVAPLGRAQLTVALKHGPEVEPGLLRSGTTRRAGYVTLPDVAPTILDHVGIAKPTEMTGALMSSAGGPAPDLGTLRGLAEDNRMAMFRTDATDPLQVALVVVQVFAYLLAALTLANARPRLRYALGLLALATSTVPLVGFLSGLFSYRALGIPGYVLAVFTGATLLAALALGLGHLLARRGLSGAHLVAPTALAGLTAAVLLADLAVGGPLQIETPFGYSAIVAGRFAGYGNLAWAILASALTIAATGAIAVARLNRAPGSSDRRLLAGVAAVFAVAVLAIGLPQFGLNFGGTLSVLPGFVVVLLLLYGLRITPQRVVAIGAVTAVVVMVFGVLDLLRPPEDRTHLGRFLALVGDQGVAGGLMVIERRINANLHILTHSVWSLLVPPAVAFLAYLAWRRPRTLRRIEESTPGLRACLIGLLVIGVIGAVANDSGVAIPAVMLAMVLPYVMYLALHLHGRP